MENAHLILPKGEEHEAPQTKFYFVLVAILVIVLVGAIVSAWREKTNYLQKQLSASRMHVDILRTQNANMQLEIDELSKENTSLKCEVYFYQQEEGKEK